MALHKFYIGGMGPYLYDDTVLIDDVDGDFAGEFQHGFITSGPLKTENVPVDSSDVLRLDDLGSLIMSAERIVEILVATGTIAQVTNMVLASGTYDVFLPTLASGKDRVYEIKNTGSGVITLKPNATEPAVEIDGEVSQPLRAGDCVSVISDNSDWWVI